MELAVREDVLGRGDLGHHCKGPPRFPGDDEGCPGWEDRPYPHKVHIKVCQEYRRQPLRHKAPEEPQRRDLLREGEHLDLRLEG